MAILGHSIQDGEEYLEIDDVSDQGLQKSGIYLSMILDNSGNLKATGVIPEVPDWTWEEQLSYLRTENLKCWCAVADLMYTRCEIISGEKSILACNECNYNWDHSKKKYLVNQPPDIRRKHWEWFVKHQKSGLRVGNFQWIEHDCQICVAEATRTPPPGYPDNNVKFCCHKCYDAAKATKKTWSAWKISMLGKSEKLKFHGNCSIMLTNSGVGGLGLNLTVATRLINFDQHLNKAAEVHSKHLTQTPCSRQTTGRYYPAY
ncbi:hypothetical protein KCU95_g3549, partial [Aureobasidium melanogenum]